MLLFFKLQLILFKKKPVKNYYTAQNNKCSPFSLHTHSESKETKPLGANVY